MNFPNHSFTPDADGHNCTECDSDSQWKCDIVAHRLGRHECGIKLLDAIEAAK